MWADTGRPVLSSSFPSVQPRNTSSARGFVELTTSSSDEKWHPVSIWHRTLFGGCVMCGLDVFLTQTWGYCRLSYSKFTLKHCFDVMLKWPNCVFEEYLTFGAVCISNGMKNTINREKFSWFLSAVWLMQKNLSQFTSLQFFRLRWLIYIHAVFLLENKQALSKTFWFWPTALASSLHTRRCQKKLLCKK